MEAKILIYVLLLIGAMGGSYAMYLQQESDALENSIEVTRQSINGMEGQVQQRARQFQSRQAMSQLLAASAALKEEKQKLEAEVRAEKDRLPVIQENRHQAIQKIRRETVGMAFPELTLTDGSTLRDAHIQQVLEEEVVIRHTQGIRRVQAKLLPISLRERIRPGETSTSLKKIEPQTTQPAPSATEDMKAEARSKHEKKILEASLAIDEMRHDLESLNTQLQQADSDLNEASSASRKYYAEGRRNHFRALVQDQKNKLAAAERAFSRLTAESPKD